MTLSSGMEVFANFIKVGNRSIVAANYSTTHTYYIRHSICAHVKVMFKIYRKVQGQHSIVNGTGTLGYVGINILYCYKK